MINATSKINTIRERVSYAQYYGGGNCILFGGLGTIDYIYDSNNSNNVAMVRHRLHSARSLVSSVLEGYRLVDSLEEAARGLDFDGGGRSAMVT